MDKSIFNRPGLYIRFKDKNTIERIVVGTKGVKGLSPVDYRKEIRDFCDCNFSSFEKRFSKRTLKLLYDKLTEKQLGYIIKSSIDDAKKIEAVNESAGATLLGRFNTAWDTRDTDYHGDMEFLKDTAEKLTVWNYQALTIQHKVKMFFPVITHLELLKNDLEKFVRSTVFYKAVSFFENGEEIKYLFFDDVEKYYAYLMFLFYNRKEMPCECELCGGYFIPKTKKKALYCDRVFKDGKTCKEIGPGIKHKMQTEKDPVLETYEREKNKMYKRMERAQLFGETPKSISADEYFAWLDKAKQVKNQYLKDEITAEDALEAIMDEG